MELACGLVVTIWLVLWSPSLSVWAQPDMLLSEERLASEAVFIGELSNNHICQAIFPEIKFTCPGNLTRWSLVAVPVGGGTRYPEVHVWRRGSSARQFVRYKRNKLSSSSPNPVGRVYQAIRDPPLVFEAGDFLGVYNPTVPALSFRYQRDGAARNYYIDGPITARETISLDEIIVQSNGNDYPLVSVEVTPPECASGFIDYDSLVKKASLLTGARSTLEFSGSTQRVIPGLGFPESGVIHNITVGAEWSYTDTAVPEIQLWRPTGQGMWTKSSSVSANANISPNVALNVHRYTPFTPLTVCAGDVLGIYQPPSSQSALRIYQLPGGPTNYVRSSSSGPLQVMSVEDRTEEALPLLSVGFSTDATSECPNTSPTGSSTTIPGGSTPTPGNHTLPSTPQSSTSSSVLVIVLTFMGVAILLVGGVAAGLVLWFIKKKFKSKPYSRAAPHHYDIPAIVGPRRPRPPPSISGSSNMEYNVNYIHKNPSVVITNGKKGSVDLEYNTAYGSDSLTHLERKPPQPEETHSSCVTNSSQPQDSTPSQDSDPFQATISAINPSSLDHYEDVDHPQDQDISAED